MKNLYYPILITVLLSSCVSSKKYSTFVIGKLQADFIAKDSLQNQEWLTINTDKIPQAENQYEQLKSSFIPAIIYWGWNSTIECAIDPSITATWIKNSIYHAADSLNLAEKAKGRQIVINLKQVPGKFLYENKGMAIIFLVAYSVSGQESISPAPINLVAEIETKSGEASHFKGEVSIPNNGQPMNNIWKSSKKFTWAYLEEYKKESQRMGTELVKQLIQNL
ncbi:hypothetical protein ACD591_11870 [Rufibacter glacialis]|uniref:DUF3313 domain-containing protein n=1 Tax=Rufibacter glacialis TaxID=1259555 RepID=A0A5M8QT06_9BACT|nr:hypothetical protein [Rufibacter glacialis]KAA6437332.1 hypothetical protein FOE74_02200 [Rufibacter glacialis]GGK60163.1 hypothetical protein GCM10011405_05370 [Rufibacter glacialis]